MKALTLVILGLVMASGCGRRVDEATAAREVRVKANKRARDLNIEGNYLRDVAEYDSALKVYRTALDIGRKHDLTERMIASILNVANVFEERCHPDPARSYYPRGRYDPVVDAESARVYYEQATEVAVERGSRKHLPSLLVDRAVLCGRGLNQPARAESLLRASLDISRELGVDRDEAFALYHLGISFGVQGRLDSARTYFEEAHKLFWKLSDRTGIALTEDHLEALGVPPKGRKP